MNPKDNPHYVALHLHMPIELYDRMEALAKEKNLDLENAVVNLIFWYCQTDKLERAKETKCK